MNMLTTPALTMSSHEIAELTGKQHKNVVRDIREMLEALRVDGSDLSHVEERKDTRGYTSEFRLDRELTELLLTGYSIPLRLKVIQRLNELETQRKAVALPNDYISALEHLLESKRSEQAAIAERDQAIATKALIGSRREATAMAKASAAVRQAQRLQEELGRGCLQATVTAVEIATGKKYPQNAYVALRSWCRSHNAKPNTVPDARFGKVKAWPAGAWLDVYQIDLAALFGGAGEQA